MIVERTYGHFVFQCDACGEELDLYEETFGDALSELRRAKWKPRKVNDYWEHICDSCNCEPDLDDFEDVS